jgi:hypothetical protein
MVLAEPPADKHRFVRACIAFNALSAIEKPFADLGRTPCRFCAFILRGVGIGGLNVHVVPVNVHRFLLTRNNAINAPDFVHKNGRILISSKYP